MPLYDAKCEDCGTVFEYISSISNRDSVPQCHTCNSKNTEKHVTKAPALGCAWSMGLVKPDRDFRDMLSRIAKNNPGSNVNDRI